MTTERLTQRTGRTVLDSRPFLRLSWQWGVLALVVIFMVGLSESGRTFASLVTESRIRSEEHLVLSPRSRTAGTGQPVADLALRELDLLRSIEIGEIGHAEALLTTGVSANAKDPQGWTPLMLAALHDRTALVPVLFAHGANPNMQNTKGTTALMLAANNGHGQIVHLLLDHGARINAKTTGGWTALMYAAWKGNSAIVSELLRAKADPTVADSQKWTALMYAAWQGHAETVEILLGAQRSAVRHERERKQARALADTQGHSTIVQLLDQTETRG